MTDNDKPVKALRVAQLDASELDNEIFDLVKTQLNQAFKYLQSGIFVRYSPEINALLKTVLWKYTVYCNGSTVGQELLNIKYGYSNRRSWITGRQKILYALLFIGCPWFKERLTDIVNILHLTQWHQQINKYIKWIENSLKLVTVCNFMLFLNRGGYINIIERLLGIQSLYPHSQNIRQVSFEFMTRELLWNGFSEFLFFILPLVNLQKIKNTIKRWTNRKTENIKTLCQRSDQDLKSCAVCSDWPINPHEIGCQHVFCYYCLFSNYKADPGFVCPLCNYGIEDETSLKPVELT